MTADPWLKAMTLQSNRSDPPPPPHDNQGTRHRALLTRIFPRHGAALNGRGQRLKWREGVVLRVLQMDPKYESPIISQVEYQYDPKIPP